MKIILSRQTETLIYAAEELKKYIELVDPSVLAEIVNDDAADGIKLGLLSDFGLDASDVSDAMIDDVVDVDIKNLSGYISGSNERSVLFGVYKQIQDTRLFCSHSCIHNKLSVRFKTALFLNSFGLIVKIVISAY